MGSTTQATERREMDNDVKPPRQPAPFDALCALPGAVVTRDEARGIVTVTWRGRYAGDNDVTIEENDAMLDESNGVQS